MPEVLSWEHYFYNPYAIPMVASGVASLFFGLFTIIKNRKAAGSIAFLILSLSFSVWLLGISIVYSSTDSETALYWVKFFWSGVVYIGSAIYFFTQSVLQTLQQRRALVVSGFIVSTVFLIFLHATDLLISGTNHYFWGYYAKAGPLVWPFLAFFFLQMTESFRSYYKRYKTEQVETIKKQIGLVAVSFLIANTASVDYLPALGFEIYPFGYILIFGFICVLFYTMARYHLLEVQTVFHKTIMWFVTSTIIFVPLILLRSRYRDVVSQWPDTQFAFLAFGLFIAFFLYVRYIQPKIDHLFQRRRYIAQSVVDHFILKLGAINSPEAVTASLVELVRGVLYPRTLSFYLQTEDESVFQQSHASEEINAPPHLRGDDPFLIDLLRLNTILERDRIYDQNISIDSKAAELYFFDLGAQLIVPFIHDHRLIAILHLGEKENFKPYSSLDIELLTKLGVQCSMALSNALIYGTLERKVAERTKALQESNEQLKSLDEMKSRFFSNITHEFRTPLVALSSTIQMIADGKFAAHKDEEKRLLLSGAESLEDMLENVNDLLIRTRSEKGLDDMTWAEIDVVAFVERALRPFAAIAQKQGNQLRLVDGEKRQPIKLYADRAKLKKIINNLVGNAMKFTKDGEIEVVVDTVGGDDIQMCRIRVRDTGPGIPSEDLPTLFDLFTQASNNRMREVQGTGLGLAMVKDFVTCHHGSVSVESELGKGSTFTVTFPLGDAHVDHAKLDTSSWIEKTGEGETQAHINLGVKSFDEIDEAMFASNDPEKDLVLLVEDNPKIVEILGHVLKESYNLRYAPNGEEGLKQARTITPTLIVSDIMMPKMNGYELVRAIKGDPELKMIPVILLTSKSDIESKLKGLDEGADEYLSKPFNNQEVLTRIKSLIEKRKMEIEFIHAEKMISLGQMVAGVAHEINNPISYAMGAADSMNNIFEAVKSGKLSLDDGLKMMGRSIEQVKDGTRRVSAITEALKGFSHQGVQGFCPSDLHKGLDSTLLIVHANGKAKVEVEKQYDLGDEVVCNINQLNQVFMNILQNAFQAIEEHDKPHVLIRSYREDEWGCVTIADNGPGISEKIKRKIFDPFFTIKDVGKGMGLGLYISRQIIAEHGGSLSVQNSPTGGAVFTIRLPIARHTQEKTHEHAKFTHRGIDRELSDVHYPHR